MKNLDMNSIEYLEFISTYHNKLNLIKENIKHELACGHKKNDQIGKLEFINFSDLNDWSPFKKYHENLNLKALADKICHMIDNGDAPNILPMIISISNNSIKSLSQPHIPSPQWDKNGNVTYKKSSEYLGKGHFRWNYRAYKLTNDEINVVKKYFGL